MISAHEPIQVHFGDRHQKEVKELTKAQTFFSVKQVHSAQWVEIYKETSHNQLASTEADALILFETSFLKRPEKEIHLGVQTADCVPLLIAAYTENNLNQPKAIAAIHSGWRGTVQKIPSLVIQEIKNRFETDFPNETPLFKAWIGPSIHQKDYQVDQPVFDLFQEASLGDALVEDVRGSQAKDSPAKESSKWLLSVSKAVKSLLFDEGIKEEDIEQDMRNTFEDPQLASYRKKKEGRQWSIITWRKV